MNREAQNASAGAAERAPLSGPPSEEQTPSANDANAPTETPPGGQTSPTSEPPEQDDTTTGGEQPSSETQDGTDQNDAEWTPLSQVEVRDRWPGMPGASNAQAVGSAAVRRGYAAASTMEFTEVLDLYEIVDPRQYGACDVFTATTKQVYMEGTPEQVFAGLDWVFLDCVDRTEELPGNYHVAAICLSMTFGNVEETSSAKTDSVVIVAGEQQHSNDAYVRGEIDGAGYYFAWMGVYREGTEQETAYNWGTTGVPIRPNTVDDHEKLVSTVQADASIDFSLGDNSGTIAYQSNDPAAKTEYESRCEQLPG